MRNDINQMPSQKSVFFWNLAGSMFNSVLSVVTLMIVTRVLSSADTDIFSIGWSISQLMETIGTFQVRMYQATDVKGTFKFSQYFQFRIVTIFIMILCSIGYILTQGYSFYKGSIVFIICLFRVVEAIMDVYEGYFQQKERLDLVGKAITYRVILTLVVFTSALYVSKSLLLASISLLLCFVFSFFFFNVRYSLRVKSFDLKEKSIMKKDWFFLLAKESLPLFVNSFLMMLIINAPKIQIDTEIASGILIDGDQTIFNILFMPASVLTLIYLVFRPLLTKMAIEWNDGRVKNFLRIVFVMLSGLSVMALITLLVCYLCGIPVLSLLYGIDLSNYKVELIITVIGGFLYTFSNVFDNALIVIRKQYLLVISYLISWIYIQLVVKKFVVTYKLMGAAIAYTTCMGVFFFVTMAIFLINMYVIRNNKN